MSSEEFYIRTAENMHREGMCARNTSEERPVFLPIRIFLLRNIYTVIMCARYLVIIRLP
jgi:hypothetical protein